MLQRFRAFCLTPRALIAPGVVAFLGIVFPALWMPGLFIEALFISVYLVLHDDLAPCFFPFLCLIILGIIKIIELGPIVSLLPFAVVPLLALAFHIYRYRGVFRPGPVFYGLCATSLAVWLGGLGSIPAKEYFSPLSLIYLFALSFGLLFLYYVYATDMKKEKSYDPYEFYLRAMLYGGLLCGVTVLTAFFRYAIDPSGSLNIGQYMLRFPYRNPLCNIIVMTLPAPFYFARRSFGKRRVLYLLAGLAIYICTVLSVARTALLAGSALLLLCIAYFLWKNSTKRTKLLFAGALLCCAALFAVLASRGLFSRITDGLLVKEEARILFLRAAVSDFRGSPFFGIGLANTRNAYIYSAAGNLSFYHMYFPQLFGSMGLFGLLAYGWQFYLRMRVALVAPDEKTYALFLVYVGLFFYSQTDIGEFYPIPFPLLALYALVLLERRAEEKVPVLPLSSFPPRTRIARILLGDQF